MSIQHDINRFYELLGELESGVGGKRKLSECNGRMDWPARGIYFFFEPLESSKNGRTRVVRIGTHALKSGSRTTLWKRLSQHKGISKSSGGNHRGSIFRLLVGNALMNSGHHALVESWGLKQDLGKAAKELGIDRQILKENEYSLESAVSQYIGNLPFLWLSIEDAPGPDSRRGIIERNSIALLSEIKNPPIMDDWLGNFSDRERVQRSKLWNNNHVDENYDPDFLVLFEKLVCNIKP